MRLNRIFDGLNIIFKTNSVCAQFAVSVAAVAAVSAGVYPVKTGVPVHSKGGNDDGSSERQKPLRDGDRFHMQSPDGQYVFGHTAGNQVGRQL